MYKLREALPEDRDRIVALLEDHEMVTAGILAPNTHYWIAEDDDQLVGVMGLELGTHAALLRSAAVLLSHRRQGIGEALTQQVILYCQLVGINVLYCFSTGAISYWQMRGFRLVPVQEVLDQVGRTPQIICFEELGWLPTEIAGRMDIPSAN